MRLYMSRVLPTPTMKSPLLCNAQIGILVNFGTSFTDDAPAIGTSADQRSGYRAPSAQVPSPPLDMPVSVTQSGSIENCFSASSSTSSTSWPALSLVQFQPYCGKTTMNGKFPLRFAMAGPMPTVVQPTPSLPDSPMPWRNTIVGYFF